MMGKGEEERIEQTCQDKILENMSKFQLLSSKITYKKVDADIVRKTIKVGMQILFDKQTNI